MPGKPDCRATFHRSAGRKGGATMHRGMEWPKPRLTWPDGKLVCCTFRVAYEAFRESGRFKQSSKIKVNVASLSHANWKPGGA
jgi:hypothetical protein